MKYLSTRGEAVTANSSFSSILLEGLAPDGGLYLPKRYPEISLETLDDWRKLSYAELAYEILSCFCDDIPADDLRSIVQRTYTPAVYRHVRQGEKAQDIVPVRYLGDENGSSIYIAGLSNGPTLAFKDMAMQLIGHLFEYALARTGDELNIVGATSGDTGSAAEYAIRGKKGVRIFMLSPLGKMSAFQTAQMYSLQEDNIFNVAISGVFDDCQDIVKAISNDAAFKSQYKIGVVNSINWARVAAQIVYYFKAYLAVTGAETGRSGALVSFSVPSGNFGNICAGYIARRMGLPIRRLVLATNENNVLDEFFKTGIYRVRAPEDTLHTSSPSMDISKASNLERFIFDLFERDSKAVRELFEQVHHKGGFDISASPQFKRIAEFGFVSGSSTHADRLETICDIANRYGAVIDPHTADGFKVARQYLEPGVPMIVLETAQPIKFAETLREALGRNIDYPDDFCGIEQLPQRLNKLPPDVDTVKAFIAKHI